MGEFILCYLYLLKASDCFAFHDYCIRGSCRSFYIFYKFMRMIKIFYMDSSHMHVHLSLKASKHWFHRLLICIFSKRKKKKMKKKSHSIFLALSIIRSHSYWQSLILVLVQVSENMRWVCQTEPIAASIFQVFCGFLTWRPSCIICMFMILVLLDIW